MRDRYIRDLTNGSSRNFEVMLEELKRAIDLFESKKYNESSKVVRKMLDGSIQTLEIMSVLALVEDDTLMGAMNYGNK